jgi:hypothetical protein
MSYDDKPPDGFDDLDDRILLNVVAYLSADDVVRISQELSEYEPDDCSHGDYQSLNE